MPPARPGLLLLLFAAPTPAQVPAPAPTPAPASLAGSRPNILFVFSDDHAAHAISAYGSKINTTPNLDRLAHAGVLFRNTFCGNSICGPSRATVLTGAHSHRNGFMRNGNVFDGSQPTFPKLLQQAGYATAIIGKWHLESEPTGFDHWAVLPGQGQYYNPDFITRDGRRRHTGHATDLTTELALEWLERRDRNKPFLLLCQHKAPHRPWLPAPAELGLYRDEEIPEPATLFDDHQGRTEATRHQEMEIGRHLYLHYDLLVEPTAAEQSRLQGEDRDWDGGLRRMNPEQRQAWDAAFAAENAQFRQQQPSGPDLVRWKYQRYIANYLRCVAGVDRSLGRLLDWLDAHPDVKANTIVVYSSDQGFYLGDNGWYDKRWMYDTSLRMPLLVAWPGRLEGGREVRQLTQNIDFAPTFLELAGVSVPAGVQGRSLVPLLAGQAPADWRDAIYYHFYESQAVHMVPAHYGVRTDRYKLIRYYEPQWDAWELFDLQQDPGELHSVAGLPEYADVRKQLERRLVELRELYGDTTGQLGNGAFALTAGIASAVRAADGWRIHANATGGYLLHQGERPGVTTLTTRMQFARGQRQRNGYVVVGSGAPRADLVRAGIEAGNRRLVIVGEDAAARAAAPVEWDGESLVEVVVTADLPAQRLTARALGQQVAIELPADWQALTSWGYGASNSETVFTELQVR